MGATRFIVSKQLAPQWTYGVTSLVKEEKDTVRKYFLNPPGATKPLKSVRAVKEFFFYNLSEHERPEWINWSI